MQTAKIILLKILKSKIFWYAVIAIIIYKVGKRILFGKDNAVEEVLNYSPESQLPSNTKEFKEWCALEGNKMIKDLGDHLSTWHFFNYNLNGYINEMLKYDDNKLIFVINGYNQLFFTNNKGSLEKDLKDVFYIAGGDRDELVNRIQTLSYKNKPAK